MSNASSLPIVHEISYCDPVEIFAKFSSVSWALLLESAQFDENFGRYSYILLDPFKTIVAKNNRVAIDGFVEKNNPWEVVRRELDKYHLQDQKDLPPLQGGIAGYFAYDLCHHLEKIPYPSLDDMQFSDLMIGFYDLVIAFDHSKKQAWIFSSGFPEMDNYQRKIRAKKRCEWLQKEIEKNDDLTASKKNNFRVDKVISNFTCETYKQAVKKVIDYICAGDIFEANISQRFFARILQDSKPFDLYCRLRELNSAPFSAYLNFNDTVLISSSPERFVKLTQKNVETRPIKGTRPRDHDPEKNKILIQDLLSSKKDHAENVMIVDLLRNDLSRVCIPHSVKVPQLCGLESYATVHHLVSVVTGQLAEGYHAIDLLKAVFPGGSITGAPKVRAMEIIAEIEPVRRGPYCGSIGYIGFNGSMDTSIAIRTYAIKNNHITFQAGGAITVDSCPEQEHEETLTKIKALRAALHETL